MKNIAIYIFNLKQSAHCLCLTLITNPFNYPFIYNNYHGYIGLKNSITLGEKSSSSLVIYNILQTNSFTFY